MFKDPLYLWRVFDIYIVIMLYLLNRISMEEFKETCIWMSYRYAIGRKTIASVTHAEDISKHMDWIPEKNWKFTAEDIFNTVNDSISFSKNINISFEGRRDVDAYSVLFEYLVDHSEYLDIDEFNKYEWTINLKTREVSQSVCNTPNKYGTFLQDYSDYKDWIRLANLFLKNTKMITFENHGNIVEEECYEWWDCSIYKSSVTLSKRYSVGNYITPWYVSNEIIKEVKDV